MGPVTDPHAHLCTLLRSFDQPIHCPRNHTAAEQFVSRADDDGAVSGSDAHYVHRHWKTSRQATSLANRVTGKASVLTNHAAIGQENRTAGQRWRIPVETLSKDPHVIAIRNEADFLTLRLLSHDRESQPRRKRARLGLCRVADGKQHSRENRSVDAPQKIGLVLVVVASAMELTVHDPGIMPGCYPLRLYDVRLSDEVPELRESVAAHARDWRPAA